MRPYCVLQACCDNSLNLCLLRLWQGGPRRLQNLLKGTRLQVAKAMLDPRPV